MTSSRRLPDFFVVGAPRAGTTSMYRYLQEHPGIYMSSYKEPSFFAVGEAAIEAVGPRGPLGDDVVLARSVPTWEAYLALFEGAEPGQLLGDASPTYLYIDYVPAVIASHVPEARIIVCVRQPVERALSHLSIANGGRPVSVAELRACLAEEATHPRTALQDKNDYLRPGLYGQHLCRWYEAFGRERVHVLRYEQLDRDTPAAIAGIYAFLGVDASFRADASVRYFQSGRFAPISFTRATRRLMPYAQRVARHLPEGARRQLAKLRSRIRQAERTATELDRRARAELTAQFFAEDVRTLAGITGEDFSGWLT